MTDVRETHDPDARAGGVRRLLILGSTGSIGTQALDVVRHVNALHRVGKSPVGFEVVGLAAGRNAGALKAQQADWPKAATALGADGALQLVRERDCDLVLAAIVGAAGIRPTLAAVERGCDVALANKEALVAAGALVVGAARRTGAKLLPVDSEHAGVFLALRGALCGAIGIAHAAPPLVAPDEIRRVTLTASGGPFRTWTREQIAGATVEQALRHPTWSMGAKVTIDSASLMNKALELIEAHWLFGLGADRLDAVIHPQSVVHALVETIDGSIIAQLGAADMRLPIQCALVHPFKVDGASKRCDVRTLGTLSFEPVDETRFPAIAMAREVMSRGGAAGAVLNAANEEAVAAFLAGRVPFDAIVSAVRRAIDEVGDRPASTLDELDAAADDARRVAGLMLVR